MHIEVISDLAQSIYSLNTAFKSQAVFHDQNVCVCVCMLTVTGAEGIRVRVRMYVCMYTVRIHSFKHPAPLLAPRPSAVPSTHYRVLTAPWI